MSSSLQRHIEARRKKMIVDKILNKKSKLEKLRSNSSARLLFNNTNSGFLTGVGLTFSLNLSDSL